MRQRPTQCGKQRARAPEDKEARRADLLRAARDLLEDSGGQLPSVSEVARRAGVTKATVYLYFQSKEELFLVLHRRWVQKWLDQIVWAGEQIKAGDSVAKVAESLAGELPASLPYLRLAATDVAVVNAQVAKRTMHEHQRQISAAMARAISAIHGAFPHVNPMQIASLLLQSYAMVLGTWQLSQYVPLPGDAPKAAGEILRFENQLRAGMRSIWQGVLEIPN